MLQMEILEMQNCSNLKEKFKEVPLLQFYQYVDREKFPKLINLAGHWAVQFGSTYVCEQCFSMMKFTKSKTRSRLTSENLDCALRLAISPLIPNWNELIAKKRCQMSHS